MNVMQLKELLKDVADNVKVLVPMSHEFDGVFYSPCSKGSGLTKMGTDPYATEEDIEEMELLGKPIPEEDTFLLLPCGFHEERDHSYKMN